MARKIFVILLIFTALLSVNAFAVKQVMPLHGKAAISSGDLRVFIYDAASGGNLIYESLSDFNSAISLQIFDINIGGKSVVLDLNYGTTYWMDLQANSENLSFNPGNTVRKQFESHVGNDFNVNSINSDSRNLLIKTNINTEVARFGIDGNFGLNTKSPSMTLDVNGQLRVYPKTGISTISLFTSSNGNVGINTSIPQNKLNIIGDFNVVTAETAIPSLYITSSDGNISIAGTGVTAGYRLDVNGDVRINRNLSVVGNILGYVSNSSFKTYFDGNSAALMPVADGNISSSSIWNAKPTWIQWGNVFDGNIAGRMPLTDVNVADNITASNYLANSFLGNLFPVPDANISNDLTLKTGQDANFWNFLSTNRIYSVDNNSLSFYTNGSERIRVLTDGNIGIGTTTPSSTFFVNGDLNVNRRIAFNGFGFTFPRRLGSFKSLSDCLGKVERTPGRGVALCIAPGKLLQETDRL